MSHVVGSTVDDVLALGDAIQSACEDACRAVEEREARKAPLLPAERALLEKLRDEGGSTFEKCAGPALDSLMLAGLAAWEEDPPRTFVGWRRVRITEAGRARLAREQDNAA
jgi:hypothetical protein